MLSQQYLVLPHHPCLVLKTHLQEMLNPLLSLSPPTNLVLRWGNLFEKSRKSDDERPPAALAIIVSFGVTVVFPS